MEKDISLVNQHSFINCENSICDHSLHHLSNMQDQELLDQNAEMDVLETRLFAMAGARG